MVRIAVYFVLNFRKTTTAMFGLVWRGDIRKRISRRPYSVLNTGVTMMHLIFCLGIGFLINGEICSFKYLLFIFILQSVLLYEHFS